jgi:hypothetical protein
LVVVGGWGGDFHKADFIFIKRDAADKKLMKLRVDIEQHTVDDVKRTIKSKTGTATSDFSLVVKGKKLDGFRRLRECVERESTLYMQTSLKGGAPNKRGRAAVAKVLDTSVKPDDPPLVVEVLSFAAPTFDEYVGQMPDALWQGFKDYTLKAKHGDRVLEWVIGNLPITARIEDDL